MSTIKRSKSKSDKNSSRAEKLCRYCEHYKTKEYKDLSSGDTGFGNINSEDINSNKGICKLNKKQIYNLTGWCRFYQHSHK